jgi:hypothetical protein
VDRDRARAASGRLIGKALADYPRPIANSRLPAVVCRLKGARRASRRAADEWPQQFDATWLNGHLKKSRSKADHYTPISTLLSNDLQIIQAFDNVF